MLRPGMIVMTARGPVLLEGRNGCHRWMWHGLPVVGGKPQKHRWCIVTNEDVTAIKVEQGFQTVLPGLLPKEKPF